MATKDFFDVDAEVGSDEDEDFEDGAAPAKVNGANGIEDSSEEEDEDDEDRIREVCHSM
jgi:transcription elongation factor SPT6